MKEAFLATFLTVGFMGAALAAPPQPGSEDADLLTPYASWIAGQNSNQGGLCCSLSDCRVVKWRIVDNSYQAFIALTDDKGFTKFPGAPNAWLVVPPDNIKRNEPNPTGQAVACWAKSKVFDNGFYCFFLPELG